MRSSSSKWRDVPLLPAKTASENAPISPPWLLCSLILRSPAVRARAILTPLQAHQRAAGSGWRRSATYPASLSVDAWGAAPPTSPAATLVESGAEACQQSHIAGLRVARKGKTLERAASAGLKGFNEGGQSHGSDAVLPQV